MCFFFLPTFIYSDTTDEIFFVFLEILKFFCVFYIDFSKLRRLEFFRQLDLTRVLRRQFCGGGGSCTSGGEC